MANSLNTSKLFEDVSLLIEGILMLLMATPLDNLINYGVYGLIFVLAKISISHGSTSALLFNGFVVAMGICDFCHNSLFCS